jgi:hypothetical protein
MQQALMQHALMQHEYELMQHEYELMQPAVHKPCTIPVGTS